MKSALQNNSIAFENVELNEYIKDYLKFNRFNNTLECFDAEINAQRMSSKLQNKKILINPHQKENAPRLYTMLKENQHQTLKEKALDQNLNIMTKKYLQILQSSRHLFSISVQLLQDFSDIKELSEAQQQKTDIYKRTLISYRKLIFSETEDPKNECPTNNQVKDIKNTLIQSVNNKEKSDIYQNLLNVRNISLNCKYSHRENLCSVFVQEDLLDLQQLNKVQEKEAEKQSEHSQSQNEQETDNYVMKILKGYDYQSKQQMLAIVSVCVSTSQGQQYLANSDNQNLILKQVIDIFNQQDNGNVSQRFCQAIMFKMNHIPSPQSLFFEQGVHQKLIEILQHAKNNKLNSFIHEYASAFIAILVKNQNIISFYSQDKKASSRMIDGLIQCLSTKFSTSTNKNILLALSCFKTQVFNQQLLELLYDEKINQFLQQISKDWSDEFEKQELLSYHASIFVSEQKKADFDQEEAQLLKEVVDQQNKNQNKKEENIEKKGVDDQNDVEQTLFFEHFTDEIDNSIYMQNQN